MPTVLERVEANAHALHGKALWVFAHELCTHISCIVVIRTLVHEEPQGPYYT
jgi:hypothetical protein